MERNSLVEGLLSCNRKFIRVLIWPTAVEG